MGDSRKNIVQIISFENVRIANHKLNIYSLVDI